MDNFYEILRALCAIPAPSGMEEPVRVFLTEFLRTKVERITRDRVGNLLCEKRGKKRPGHPILLSAHMDEVGLMLTEFCEDGTLKFRTVGGVESSLLSAKRILFPEAGLHGVISAKPIHLIKKDDFEKAVRIEDLRIDIGAKDRADAEALLGIGDEATFVRNYLESGTKIRSAALDDRIGCALLAELCLTEPEYDFTAVFTVKEECGLRGAKSIAAQYDNAFAVAVEATTASDLPKADGADAVCFQQKGAVLSFADRGTLYDRKLTQTLYHEAQSASIACQIKQRVAGGNDAAALQRAAGAKRVLAISAPCRYIHSPVCVADRFDLDAMRALLPLCVRVLGETHPEETI